MDTSRRDALKLLAAVGGAAFVNPSQAQQNAPEAKGQTMSEPARDLPVVGEYDVVVVGGGIAGVAAAVAAARLGVRTALLEKQMALGGLATLGNVVVYLPLCDGRGHQVIGGLGEEMLKRSVRDQYRPLPGTWTRDAGIEERAKERYKVTFNAASCMLELEEMVVEAGVDLWYDVRFCDVIRGENRIDAVIVENKSGRQALRCRTVIDTSGDADVCARAGEETVSRRTNVPCGWYYYTRGGKIRLSQLTEPFLPDPTLPPPRKAGYAGDDARDVTAHTLHSRRLIRDQLKTLREQSPTEAIFPAALALFPSFRMTRRLKGRVELQVKDDKRWFEDTVGMTGYWRKAGPVYCLPLSCLAGVRNRNLITAGRCISSAGVAWDVTRVIPTCAVTGEAAGVAAALAAGTDGNLDSVPVARIQKQLLDQKGILDRSLLGG